MVRTKDDRIYLRIDADLKQKVERWAEKHNMSLSDVVTRFFRNLILHERKTRWTSSKKSLTP